MDSHPSPAARRRRAALAALALAVVALVGWLVWQWSADKAAARREAPRLPPMVALPPPPPPPPPPPEQKPPEVKERMQAPEPKPMEPAKPAEVPKPANDAPESVTMNADAQAGAGGIQIGSGGGMGGGGSGGGRAGNATYGQYLAYALQRAVQRDPATARLAYPQLLLHLWLDDGGRITRVELVRSSGDAKTDEALLAALRAVGQVDEKPPAGLTFPARVAMQARRP